MCNSRVKFGLKIPNRLGKMSENFRGIFFDSHCIRYKASVCSIIDSVIAVGALDRLVQDREHTVCSYLVVPIVAAV